MAAPHNPHRVWTDEQRAYLVKLTTHLPRYTYARIQELFCEEFGTFYTLDAIDHEIRRLGTRSFSSEEPGAETLGQLPEVHISYIRHRSQNNVVTPKMIQLEMFRQFGCRYSIAVIARAIIEMQPAISEKLPWEYSQLLKRVEKFHNGEMR
jgi:hypothetical protein